MPRKPMTFQFDLFSSPHYPEIDQMPHWRGLPMQTRQELMPLIVRLLLDYATSDPALASEEMRDDHDRAGRRADGFSGVARFKPTLAIPGKNKSPPDIGHELVIDKL